MATIQIDGGSAVTLTSTHNDRGVIKFAGNIADSTLITNAAVGLRAAVADLNTYPVSGSNGNKGVSAKSNFFINVGESIISRVTSTIYDVANTKLRSGASHMPGDSGLVPLEADRSNYYASGIRAGNWSAYSGVFYPTLNAKTTSFGADNAARCRRGYQGTYRFLYGGPNSSPSGAQYDIKTG